MDALKCALWLNNIGLFKRLQMTDLSRDDRILMVIARCCCLIISLCHLIYPPQKLYNRQVNPPFKPACSRDDAFYFDTEFTSRTPRGASFNTWILWLHLFWLKIHLVYQLVQPLKNYFEDLVMLLLCWKR